MAVERKDEVLGKALDTDTEVIPRFDIVLPSGLKVAENAQIVLKNPVEQEGMPINKAVMDECLAASGTTAGTATKLTLEQSNFVLNDGALIRFKLHTDSGATPTMNVNGTGAKALMQTKFKPMRAGVPSGTWLTAIYSETFGFFLLQGSESQNKLKYGNDVGQISSFELMFCGHGNPDYSRKF